MTSDRDLLARRTVKPEERSISASSRQKSPVGSMPRGVGCRAGFSPPSCRGGLKPTLQDFLPGPHRSDHVVRFRPKDGTRPRRERERGGTMPAISAELFS